MHKSITTKRVIRLVKREDGSGICKACGKTASCCEPDARNYTCDRCDKPAVFGAEELLFEVC
jgi:hypothetical protein